MRSVAVTTLVGLVPFAASGNGPALPAQLAGHGGPVKSITVSADGTRVLTASFDYSLILWDIDGPEAVILHRLLGHDGAVNDAAFLPDGGALSVGDDGDLIVWDLRTGTIARRVEADPVKVRDVAVSPDGRWAVTARWDETAHLHDLRDGTVRMLAGHRGNVNAAAFDPDGGAVYTAAHDGQILAWSLPEGRAIRPVLRHGWGITTLAALGGGRLVFGTTDGAAGMVEIDTGATRFAAKGETPVQSVKVSADRALWGYGDAKGRIGIFTAEGSAVETGTVAYGPVWDFDFVPGTAHLYHVGLDDFAALWRIAPRDLAPIRSELPRRFQLAEAADPGELEFLRKCSVCHTLTPDDGNRAGPTLYGLFGRRVGAVPGYPYSDALTGLDLIWTETTVAQLFDEGPDVMLPGTKMPVQRLKQVERRDDLIRWLKAATAPIE